MLGNISLPLQGVRPAANMAHQHQPSKDLDDGACEHTGPAPTDEELGDGHDRGNGSPVPRIDRSSLTSDSAAHQAAAARRAVPPLLLSIHDSSWLEERITAALQVWNGG